MARRMRLTVAYDGAGFHGFAENHDVRTVMGVLRQTIETVLQTPVHLVGAGRTDAGVHGWGQVVSGEPDVLAGRGGA
jgi:tRNA pseudouridine38-40 synthase